MFFPEQIRQRAADVFDLCLDKKWKLASAESCTGGLFSALFTEIIGASEVFERGYVTYSNESKSELLGIPSKMVAVQGAVSEQVAAAMAQGAIRMAQVDVAVAITGIAGPGGGTAEKPVGTVFVAVATEKGVKVTKNLFVGDRHLIRLEAVSTALDMLKEALKD